MENVLLSIIVPVYNAEKYIARCINSILCQKFSDFELILINDGSVDGTYDILEQYRSEPKCVIFHQENGGVSSARNLGIQNARGKFISFVDADDYVADNYFDILVPLMSENPQLISFNSFYEYQKDDFRQHSRPLDDGVYSINEIKNIRSSSGSRLIGIIGVTPWNKIYRREIIQKNNLLFRTDMKTCEDVYFVTEYLMKIKKCTFCSEPLYYYCDNPMSSTYGDATACLRKISDYMKYFELERKYEVYLQASWDEEENFLRTMQRDISRCVKLGVSNDRIDKSLNESGAMLYLHRAKYRGFGDKCVKQLILLGHYKIVRLVEMIRYRIARLRTYQ